MKRIIYLFVWTALLLMGGRSFAQNKHQYVDLGLPSGTLWATCNIGANYPWEYGNYYAWGETKTKTDYHEKTYKYCKGDIKKLTKYCNQSEYGNKGFTDKLTKLQKVDDVATAQWGKDWCMPTKEQWLELKQCAMISEWTELNGVYGMLFIGTNGNQLFLPVADARLGNRLYDDPPKAGCYWSSSLDTDKLDPGCAWYFYFSSKQIYDGMDTRSRYMGQSVRPVRSAR